MNLNAGWFGGGGSGAEALGLDYRRLVASLAAAQAASRTAAWDVKDQSAPRGTEPTEALVTLFTAQPGWDCAVAALGGSFSPAVAKALTGPELNSK